MISLVSIPIIVSLLPLFECIVCVSLVSLGHKELIATETEFFICLGFALSFFSLKRFVMSLILLSSIEFLSELI